MTAPYALPAGSRFHVAGHGGLVGSAVWRHLSGRDVERLGHRSAELHLRDCIAVNDFYDEARPSRVVLAAAKVIANSTYPADFLSHNPEMQVNVMAAAQLVLLESRAH